MFLLGCPVSCNPLISLTGVSVFGVLYYVGDQPPFSGGLSKGLQTRNGGQTFGTICPTIIPSRVIQSLLFVTTCDVIPGVYCPRPVRVERRPGTIRPHD